MRAILLFLAVVFQKISAFFGRLAIATEYRYYTLTEMGRA